MVDLRLRRLQERDKPVPKLIVRVRFPSPAPRAKARSGPVIICCSRRPREPLLIVRAISVPLARGGQDFGRAFAVLVLLALDVSVDGARDELVGAAGLMFSGGDHCCSLAVVAHAGHQVPDPGAAPGRELVPGMAKVVGSAGPSCLSTRPLAARQTAC